MANRLTSKLVLRLKGEVKTWVRLPRERWPKEWAGMSDPVCPLEMALYGHPEAGGHWEAHLESKIIPEGFVRVECGWRSVLLA